MIYAYHRAMKIIEAEGFAERYKRHAAIGKAIRSALKVYGMSVLAKEEVAAPTLSCILYPDGIDDVKFRASLAEKGLIVAGHLGPLAGKGFRLGHMGNVTNQELCTALEVIGSMLKEQGIPVNTEDAVRVFNEVFAENNK